MVQDPIIHAALMVVMASFAVGGAGIVFASILRGPADKAIAVAVAAFLCIATFTAIVFWLIVWQPV